MAAKAICLNLTNDMKRMVWLNTILIITTISAVSIYLGSFMLMAIILSTGILAGIASHLYVHRFYIRKTEVKLNKSLNKTYKELKEEMSFDGLTGVYDRKTGEERLKEEFARAKRSGEDLSIAIIDADNFKQINDTYGHLTGDEVLRSIAGTIKNLLRIEDILFRYGGEEFVIIMPDTSVLDASIPLERLREKLSDKAICYNNNHINVSVSIGVATALKGSDNIEEVIHRADEALYSAKRTGKNKVVYHTELATGEEGNLATAL